MVAHLAGFGSFWALGDCSQPNWARGTISRCHLKLQHQPWALWISGLLYGSYVSALAEVPTWLITTPCSDPCVM